MGRQPWPAPGRCLSPRQPVLVAAVGRGRHLPRARRAADRILLLVDSSAPHLGASMEGAPARWAGEPREARLRPHGWCFVTAPLSSAFGDFAGRTWLNTAHQGALPLAAA